MARLTTSDASIAATAPGGFHGQVNHHARSAEFANALSFDADHWFTEDDCTLMCFGEIHNIAELAAELHLETDVALAKLLLVAWRRWDRHLFRRLDGVFALALRTQAGLLLYRDPSGFCDLYAHVVPAGPVSFASDLGRLVRLPGVERRLSRPSLHEYLRFGDVAAPRTIYRDVLSLEPGVMTWCSSAGVESLICPGPTATTVTPTYAQAVDQLELHLQRAVASRLTDAKHPAVFLSGGVDSSLLCAIAGQLRPDLTALTVGFDRADLDESPVAAGIARHLGVHHEVLRFGRAEQGAAFARLCAGAGQPSADPATTMTVLALDACRGRFDVVLDGTGADEALGLLPPRHIRVAVQFMSRVPAPLRALLTRLLRTLPSLASYAALTDFEHPADTMIRWKGFQRHEIEQLCNEPVSFAGTRFYRTFASFSRSDHFALYSALVEAMPSERLNHAMRVSGVRLRFPFCESAANQFVRGLPLSYRYQDGQPKRILRTLLARHVPSALWEAPKHGFDVPLLEFMDTNSATQAEHQLQEARWASCHVLSPSAVAPWIAAFKSGDTRFLFRVWQLVLLGAWMEAHGDPC